MWRRLGKDANLEHTISHRTRVTRNGIGVSDLSRTSRLHHPGRQCSYRRWMYDVFTLFIAGDVRDVNITALTSLLFYSPRWKSDTFLTYIVLLTFISREISF